MSGGDPIMPPDLDRVLASATVPAMPAGLIDRIVAEAARPGRAALPAPRPTRSRGRQWTRRGVWSGIVAVNLMLATAVAAAFGGGALTFATIATVARHVVEHIRAPFHHAPPRERQVRPAVVHRLAVPAAAIRTTPRVVLPMAVPRPFAGMPPVSVRPLRPMAVDRARSPMRAGPYAIRHAAERQRLHDRPYGGGMHRRDLIRPHGARAIHGEPRRPMASPMAPYAQSRPRAGEGGRDAPAVRGLRGQGGRRFDGAGWRTPATIGTDDRAVDRGGWQGGDRAPGWRRRMQGDTVGAGAPGWRRRAGFNGGGGGRPGARMRTPRPWGGRPSRRF